MQRFETVIGGRPLVFETGKLAGLAHGAVTVRYGDTIILATATMSREPREGIDFFPLTVDFEERLYAAGKIPGGFLRREGRPSEQAILTARLTDRPLRPMFPKGMRNDVQIVVTALSADQEHQPDILTIVGASAALTISQIPFDGPVGAVRVGSIDGQFVVNPTSSQLLLSKLDLVVAGSADAVVMVEAEADEVPEEEVHRAIRFGHEQMQAIIALQRQMRDAVGRPKYQFVPQAQPEALRQAVSERYAQRLEQALYNPDKASRESAVDALRDEALAQLQETYAPKEILQALGDFEKQIVRTNILAHGRRPDGREPKDIRPVSCEVGLLPRTHGSGLFTRGQTQVLTIATLGSTAQEQMIEGLGIEETKRFLHHYSMPPFSTGETRPLRGPGRREIGHGALAERAVAPVIPPKETFPYTIRLVSEVVSSNGSTSMGSVCGSSLALMDAGVPIRAPVGGIAMGLITDDAGRYAILTDIQGMEDALGDMDFKVAGTRQGVTAVQMDIKLKGLTDQMLREALAQAREARMRILDHMAEAIAEPRPQLSAYAPRMERLQIPVDKIGALIGPGGRTIRGIQDETRTKIQVEDDGSVFVSSPDRESVERAVAMIERLTREVEVGQSYLGKVMRITPFGAFVEILPGKEGLVRLSELAEAPVVRAEDVVSLGDEVMVRVIEIDSLGRINLSRRAMLEGAEYRPSPRPPAGVSGGRGGPRFGGPPGAGPGRGGERRPPLRRPGDGPPRPLPR
ncbi:MAG: polyribonucleotide nucleotidyltransferase [Chloroflexi bacterium]|nr:polyribonucleotide nucleotidyltransferase [Chloroflexota bacterium]